MRVCDVYLQATFKGWMPIMEHAVDSKEVNPQLRGHNPTLFSSRVMTSQGVTLTPRAALDPCAKCIYMLVGYGAMGLTLIVNSV